MQSSLSDSHVILSFQHSKIRVEILTITPSSTSNHGDVWKKLL